MTRPATFVCSWCGKSKPLARTGRMPRFCSDSCRKAPAAAEFQLQNARYQLRMAERAIAYLEEGLARFRLLEETKTRDAVNAACQAIAKTVSAGGRGT